ncbi:arginine--tRNA ligase, partial [Acinetobacter baumannii]
VEVSPPREASHGDLASNAAMVLAKAAGKKPRDIADRLAKELAAHSQVARVEVAGPGFLNLTLHPAFWHAVVAAVLREGPDFGRCNLGQGAKTNV